MSNQVVGTTNRNGDLLIPNLLHYYGNRVGIDDKDIPLDHDIGATERTIAPPYRGGVVVAFPVRRVQSVAGSIAIDEGGVAVSPAYGQIVVTAGERRVISPLDEVGNFYLEDLAPGSYAAEVQYAKGVCNFALVVPAGSTALVDVGAVRCTVKGKETK
jgi:outer membrane usher protein